MSLNVSYEALATAGEHRQQLADVIGAVSDVASTLDSASIGELAQIHSRVESDAFRVMIVGEFKKGKSTLVNALLGADVLPSFARPATAVVTEVRWAEQPRAVLHPADGGEAVEVDVDQLTDRITIPPGVAQGSEDTSPWRLAQIGWPLEICENGVVLIDSPGLNEHPVRQEVTLGYLHNADAIVFMMDATAAVSMEEQRFVSRFLDAYDVFMVVNKINFVDEDERDELQAHVVARMQGHRGPGRSDRYYFVNAKAAVKARATGDWDAWDQSGVGRFANDLNSYLVAERHRAKVIVTARDVRRVIRGLRQRIPEHRALIEADAGDLQARYESVEMPLRDLERRAKQIRQLLDQQVAKLCSDVENKVQYRLIGLSDEVQQIVAEVQPTASLSLNPLKVKSAAEEYAQEVASLTANALSDRFSDWTKSSLSVEIGTALEEVAGQADEHVSEFLDDLRRLRARVTGVDSAADEQTMFADVADRVRPSGVTIDGMHAGIGLSHLAKQIVASLAVMTVWAFTPFTLIPLIIAVVLTNAAILGATKDKMAKTVRQGAADEISRQLRDDARSSGERAGEALRSELEPVVVGVMANVDGRVGELRSQVEAALKALREGTGEVDRRRGELERIDKVLDEQNQVLEDLISDVAMS